MSRTPLTIRTRPTLRTSPAASAMPEELVLEFDSSAQTLSALQAAAYRLIGTASCQIEKADTRWVCRLEANGGRTPAPSHKDALRAHFIDLVTDENLRERIAAKTEPVRNLILALAFGSLAADPPPDAR